MSECEQPDPLTEFRARIPREYLEEMRLLPVEWRDGVVVLAHSGAPDPQAVGELGVLFGVPMRLREMEEEDLLRELRETWNPDPGTAEEFIAELDLPEAASGEELAVHDLEEMANQAPVVRLVNLILTEAVEAGASDVHLESSEEGLEVRYRVDGMLREAPSPPSELRAAVLSRLKIMAELDIAERRLPQDGRFGLRIQERRLDVRVSTLPSLHGESVVLRLLQGETEGRELESLGMAEDHRSALAAFAERPQGLLLATGPTGSGKTTTLHALVRRLRKGREKIVAVEDPVEYELPGVVQVPVQSKAGLTFARALRSILRQDPDVLLVGEMRDAETAEICVQAALTGHLVLSTLHTNDAPSAVTRLLNLGVPDYLAASTLELVLAQRLVRTLCRDCGDVRRPTEAEARATMEAGYPSREVGVDHGCPACHMTGYRGRTGIYEMFTMGEDFRDVLLRREGDASLRRLALRRGMRSLRDDGWRQVSLGATTPAEIVRVTSDSSREGRRDLS